MVATAGLIATMKPGGICRLEGSDR